MRYDAFRNLNCQAYCFVKSEVVMRGENGEGSVTKETLSLKVIHFWVLFHLPITGWQLLRNYCSFFR